MLSSKINRIGQILVIVLTVAYLNFSQISGGGAMSPGAIGGSGISSSLSGQLGGILNKNIFAKAVKKNAVSPAKPNVGTGSKNPVSKPSKTASKNKSVKRPTAKPATVIPDSDYESPNSGVINYQPIGDTKIDQVFADSFAQNAEQRAALLMIFGETKKLYNVEAKKLGRPNDLALVFTFFISACLTVYHDAPEPTDEATENLYQVIAQSLSESPEIAIMSNDDKQINADKLIYISGLIYAGYLSGKQTQDAETVKIYRQVAGVCLETLIGISPESIEFDKNGLRIRS